MSGLGRVGIAAALFGVIALAIAFRRAQNARGGAGGAISAAKLVWLAHCVYAWFLVCPLVAREPSLAPALRLALGAFAACMWARGVAEMVMLYGTKSWRPPYGVAHDLFSIALLGGLLVWRRADLLALSTRLDLWALTLALFVLASLVVETVYAVWFHKLVEGRTTGDEGVWFADPESAHFRSVNRITCALNIPLVTFQLAFATWALSAGT